MSCIKTGFYGYLVPYNLWVYGDAFESFGVTWFRICEKSDKPLSKVRHFTINDWSVWYDEDKTSMAQNSTMICDPYSTINHGYNGVPE